MVVLVLLVILCSLAYTLSLRVSSYRSRGGYMVDYQSAQYARDTAVKYALTMLQDINEPNLISRPNEPDFSDLFFMTEEEYRQALVDWAQSMSDEQALAYRKKIKEYLTAIKDTDSIQDFNSFIAADGNSLFDVNDLNDLTDLAKENENLQRLLRDSGSVSDINDPNNLQIPGPYGPRWPLIIEPMNLVIGNATVNIEIHDENAKYPISWLMIEDEDIAPQIQAGFETLCEMMDIETPVTEQIADELMNLNEVKRYTGEFKDVTVVKRERVEQSRTAGRTRSSRRVSYRTVSTKIPASSQMTDFARLFHSPLLNTEPLAKPAVVADDRVESALKYISLWPTSTVNINTAPRNVLRAVFSFGGASASVNISDAIIERRRIKPFEDPNELRQEIFRYADSIEKSRKYIVTKSNIYTIRITANSGLARTSAIIAVRNNNGRVERIAVLSD